MQGQLFAQCLVKSTLSIARTATFCDNAIICNPSITHINPSKFRSVLSFQTFPPRLQKRACTQDSSSPYPVPTSNYSVTKGQSQFNDRLGYRAMEHHPYLGLTNLTLGSFLLNYVTIVQFFQSVGLQRIEV